MAAPGESRAGEGLLPPLAWGTSGWQATLYPSVDLGTQVDRIGVTARVVYEVDLSRGSLRFGGFIADKLAARSLGISGTGTTLSFGLDAIAGLGGRAAAPSPFPDFAVRSPWELRFEWLAYLDTWHTSQLSARIELVHALGASAVGFALEDDGFGGRFDRDEWRTGAGEISYAFRAGEAEWAVSAGVTLWTGSKGTADLHRGQTYTMLPSLAGYGTSAGILYLGVRRGAVRLQLGWDSEGIRNVVQNDIHYVIDDGRVPLVDRRPRPYLQISLYPDGDLY